MKQVSLKILWTGLVLFSFVGLAGGHCEIPCGIYDDEMRVNMIAEHITTIEKSMRQILSLQGAMPVNSNQLTRWVVNKEHHADALQEIVARYFMTQRIKPDAKDYEKKLTVLHKMLLHAMKSKQTTDLDHIRILRSLLKDFRDLYFGEGHQ